MKKDGNRMITVKVRFWTNDISSKGEVTPKHGWASGMVNLETNPLHDIKSSPTLPFHSLLDIGAVIEKVLLRDGIKLRASRKMSRYMEEKKHA